MAKAVKDDRLDIVKELTKELADESDEKGCTSIKPVLQLQVGPSFAGQSLRPEPKVREAVSRRVLAGVDQVQSRLQDQFSDFFRQVSLL